MTTTILVHGFTDTARRMNYMTKYLSRRGWKILTPTLYPSNGDISLEELAEQLAAFISVNIPVSEQINLVGFSMGGLICRYYLQRLGGLSKTDKFISISTPHNGTKTAHLFRRPGIQQMLPKSLFLQDLNKDANRLLKISCTVLYTPMDLTIIPARSSIVSFAPAIWFPVPIHVLMVYYRPLLKTVDQILRFRS